MHSYLLCKAVCKGCKIHGIPSSWMDAKQPQLGFFRFKKRDEVICCTIGRFVHWMYRFLGVDFPLCRVVRPWFSIKWCLFCGHLILDRSFAKPSNDVLYQLSRGCVRLGEVEYLLIKYQPCCNCNYYLVLSLQHVLKIQRNNPSFELFPQPVNSNTSASIGFYTA